MPNAAANEAIIVGGLNPVEGKVFSVPTHPEADEKEVITSDTARTASNGTLEEKIRASSSPGDDTDDRYEDGEDSDNVIIITGGDAARHLLPMRDDHDPALTFRGIILASGLSCFQAVLSQIYTVSQHMYHVPRGTFQAPRLINTGGCLIAVQTNRGCHLGNLYRPHRILCRQSLGRRSPPWRQV